MQVKVKTDSIKHSHKSAIDIEQAAIYEQNSAQLTGFYTRAVIVQFDCQLVVLALSFSLNLQLVNQVKGRLKVVEVVKKKKWLFMLLDALKSMNGACTFPNTLLTKAHFKWFLSSDCTKTLEVARLNRPNQMCINPMTKKKPLEEVLLAGITKLLNSM